MYSEPDKKGIPATFQILNFIGWKPDPSQKGPAKRGSGQVSLKDLDKVSQITKEMEKTQNKKYKDDNLDDLSKELERLRMSLAKQKADEDGSEK